MTIRVNHEKKELELSVRDLAFFGISRRLHFPQSFRIAEQGQEIHQTIQSQKLKDNPNYKLEYFVKHEFKIHNWKITIRGRIDLLAQMDNLVKIEEIKSIFLREFNGSLEDSRIRAYVVQLQYYAWLFKQRNPDSPRLQLKLILVNCFDNTKYDLGIQYQDMSKTINASIGEIIQIEEGILKRQKDKIASLSNLQFPFTYRNHQREIIQKIRETISNDMCLILEAPSGLGKTVVSLFPSISDVIKENRKLFFLTAKTTQRRIVEQTIKLFQKQGVSIQAITLKAKEKICTNPFYFCHEDYCPFLRNYLAHFPEEHIQKFLQQGGVITPEEIEEQALATEAFCPFELALDISLEVDVIICDYNYVFHPRVLLQRFFGDHIPKYVKYYLIIDEAHNLVDRSLSYYSHNLTLKDINKFKRAMNRLRKKYKDIPLPNLLPSALERFFRELRSEYNSSISIHLLEELNIEFFQNNLNSLEEKVSQYLKYLIDRELHWPDDPILNFYYRLRDFVETVVLSRNTEEFSILYNLEEGEIRILCKDASRFLNQRLKVFKSVIALSATINPFHFYRDLLGFAVDRTLYQRYPSPFPPRNRKILVFPDVDTRYKQRSQFYEEIASLIQNIVNIKTGRYFAFFPSFQYANNVTRFFQSSNEVIILNQTNLMNDLDRSKFISTLETEPYVLAIAVTSGIFAEGIDIPGILDGIFVISPSLPPVSFERELLRQYYEEKFGLGFSYAYQFPGLTRTYQAAGRLIRTVSDRGVIVFIGHRFARPMYANHFPPYYFDQSPRELISREPQIYQDIKDFWKKMENQSKM